MAAQVSRIRLALLLGAMLPMAVSLAGCGLVPSGSLPGDPTVTVTVPAVAQGGSSATPRTQAAAVASPIATAQPGASSPANVLPPVTAPAATGLGPLRTYANPRYGFSIGVPSRMASAPEAAKGDGRAFTWERTTLTVYGFNVGEGIPAPTPASMRAEWVASGAKVTYEAGGTRAFSISGTQGSMVFYDRYLCGAGSCVAMRWRYPVSEKETIDPAVTQSVKSFVAGDLSSSH